MSIICHTLQLLCAAALGIFAGAMLTEGFVLVPHWRSLPAHDFFAWYAANDRRLLGYFGPLTALMALLSLAAAITSIWIGDPSRSSSMLAAFLSLVVVSTFFLYFKRANDGFTAGRVSPDALPAELRRWAAWHWARTGISLLALAAGLLALAPPR